MTLHRRLLSLVAASCLCALAAESEPAGAGQPRPEVKKFCRFQKGQLVAYGIVEQDRVRQLSGDIFGAYEATGTTYSLDEVRLLVPTQPKHVFAMAGNYRSHLSAPDQSVTTITTVTTLTTDVKTKAVESQSVTTVETRSSAEVPETFRIPQPFLKTASSLLPHGGRIVLPRDAQNVHYEAEMVIVIGRRAKNVSRDEALDYVFGVTCGNDVSARVWQKNDVQWWRAKGADTFGPVGPFIARGLNYDDLQLRLRVNGQVRQDERTSQMIHDVSALVSFLSRYVTLEPGDLIFTGTSGTTDVLQPGDVVEVELEGVGILRNEVAAEE